MKKMILLILILVVIILILILITTKIKIERYENPLENINYIIGPVSGSYHVSNKYDKKIYIFGDIHVNKIFCPPEATSQNTIKMIDFLIRLANTKDNKGDLRKLDYFLEATSEDKYTSEIIEGFRRRGTPIDEVLLNFINCLKIIKDDCQYKNVRFHYSDIRISNEELKELILLGLQLTMLIKNSQNLSFIDSLKNKFNWDRIKRILANVENIFKDSKIDKQIENIKIGIVKELMLRRKEIVSEQFVEIFMMIDLIAKIIENNLIPTLKQNIQLFNTYIRFVNLIQDSTAEMMDIYLFSRIFREFKREDDEKSNVSKEIVIYVGEHHAERYRLYLSALGFNQKNLSQSEKIGENYQCIDITSFKPFWN